MPPQHPSSETASAGDALIAATARKTIKIAATWQTFLKRLSIVFPPENTAKTAGY